ncbi:hypothetical protein P3S67_024180 [Capsicum chacoense]
MINTICWNARSINTKGALGRLQHLKNVHKLSLIAILEPFSDNSQLNTYKNHLRMDKAYCNLNGKIWIFWSQNIDCTVLDSDDQQITCELKHVVRPSTFLITFIYAKRRDHLRRPLWDKILHHAEYNGPWCNIGDFNVITTTEEKMEEVPYNMNKSFEFIVLQKLVDLRILTFMESSLHGVIKEL